MPRTRTSARQTLLDAALILLSENPEASFMQIAEYAGVGRASLYRHFPSREALIHAVCMDALELMSKSVAPIFWQARDIREALEMVISATVPLGDRLYFLTRVGNLADRQIADEIQRQDSEMIQLIESAQKQHILDPSLSASWINRVFVSLICSAWDAMKQENISDKEACALVSRSLFSGMSPPHAIT